MFIPARKLDILIRGSIGVRQSQQAFEELQFSALSHWLQFHSERAGCLGGIHTFCYTTTGHLFYKVKLKNVSDTISQIIKLSLSFVNISALISTHTHKMKDVFASLTSILRFHSFMFTVVQSAHANLCF